MFGFTFWARVSLPSARSFPRIAGSGNMIEYPAENIVNCANELCGPSASWISLHLCFACSYHLINTIPSHSQFKICPRPQISNFGIIIIIKDFIGMTQLLQVRDRSLFIVQGGLRRNWGPFKFFKTWRGALKKYRETKEGGLWKYLPVWKNSSFKNVTQVNLTTNNNVYRPSIFITIYEYWRSINIVICC
jgi:hypothetical protein